MEMADVLILTQINDIHAAAVALGLERKGSRPHVLLGGDFPVLQTGSVTITNQQCSVRIDGPGAGIDAEVIDTVWNRRWARPRLPDTLHPGDRMIAEGECLDFGQALHSVLAPEAFWVNPPAGARAAGSKLLQLKLADAVGLEVPETLASNDPVAIRAFVRRHQGNAIYKTFRPAIWETDAHITYAFTSRVDETSLPDDELLRLTPGIFQPLVPKAFELRLTLLGRTCIGAKLRSQEHGDAIIDWRGGGIEVPVEPYAVDAALQARCFELLRRLGLVSGCIDFLVTPDGRMVFLEVNEGGQWLWLEETCPDIPVLDAFIELVRSGPHFAYRATSDRVRYASLQAEAIALLARQRTVHVEHTTWPAAVDTDAAIVAAG